MDGKSKILIGLFFLVVLSAVYWKYNDTVVRKDFIIHDFVSCDPSSESCFTEDCSAEDSECDTSTYKKLSKHAVNIPACLSSSSDDCPVLSCEPGEAGCAVTFCSLETVESGEKCATMEASIIESTE